MLLKFQWEKTAATGNFQQIKILQKSFDAKGKTLAVGGKSLKEIVGIFHQKSCVSCCVSFMCQKMWQKVKKSG
jgi:hypothetical protein